MLTYTPIKDNELHEPKFFFLTEAVRKNIKRSDILAWFASTSLTTLYGVPKELLKEPMLKVSGDIEILNYLRDKSAVHIPNTTENNNTDNDTDKTDPSKEFSTYGVLFINNINDACLLIKLTDDSTQPPFRFTDIFTLYPGMIDNYNEKTPTYTDVGKFIANVLLCVKPFGKNIPYINSTMTAGSIDDKVAQLILDGKAGRKEFNTYMKLGYWFYADGALTVTPFSEKTMGTSDEIIAKKNELFKKYKDNLNDPVVISKIESELMDMDKKYLRGDPAEPFFFKDPKAGFGDWRKKMFLTFGGAPDFTNKKSSIIVADESLEDGWTTKDLVVCANVIRRGVYSRHRETAKGGEQTKFLLRIFQNIKIIEEDCKTKTGIKVMITNDNYKTWVGRYQVGHNEPLTLDELKKDIGFEIEIRSPMHCKTDGGFCFKCCGDFFRKTDIEAIGMQGLAITSAMTGTAMKAMKSTQVNSNTLTDIDKILLK